MIRIADAHCDTLYKLAIKGQAIDECCVTAARMQEGGQSLQTFAMFSSYHRPNPHADALRMLDAYLRYPLPHLDGRLPERMPEQASSILSIEGGEMLRGSIAALQELDDRAHVRLLALTWNYENEIATAARVNACDGLKPFGFELLKEMDKRGIAADVSHLNEAGFWDVVRTARIAPLASHSGYRPLCDVPRNLSREQVRALIERKGFIGINFYSYFLQKDGNASIQDVVSHIDAICELGGEDIVGFGSDFDGIDAWPPDLASPLDYPRLLDALRQRGYDAKALEKIAGKNYWRFLLDAQCAIDVSTP